MLCKRWSGRQGAGRRRCIPRMRVAAYCHGPTQGAAANCSGGMHTLPQLAHTFQHTFILLQVPDFVEASLAKITRLRRKLSSASQVCRFGNGILEGASRAGLDVVEGQGCGQGDASERTIASAARSS